MPYGNLDELPDNVRSNLPEQAQEIYLAAYNNAAEQYADPEKRRGQASLEEIAHKVAWAAVKQKYRKDRKSGEWVRKASGQ
ncbi:MAG: ChaB family protein [Dehalococcoidia bacterium]